MHEKKKRSEMLPMPGTLRQTLYCDKCSFSCDRPAKLEHHNIIHHTTEKPFQCDQCSYAGKFSRQLKTHMRNVHEDREKSFTCSLCSYATHVLGNLKQHEAFVHAYRRFSCDICHKPFAKMHLLKKHQYRTHQAIHDFPCPECDKAFFDEYHLKQHMWQHTGVKEWPCRYCELEFSRSLNYVKHVQRKHPESKAFVCDKCEFATDSRRVFHHHKLKLSHIDPTRAKKNYEISAQAKTSVEERKAKIEREDADVNPDFRFGRKRLKEGSKTQMRKRKWGREWYRRKRAEAKTEGQNGEEEEEEEEEENEEENEEEEKEREGGEGEDIEQ